MATFPGSVVTITDPTSTSKLNSPSHATQHTTLNAEVIAIETSLKSVLNTAGSFNIEYQDSPAAKTSYVIIPYACTVNAKAVVTSGTTGTGATINCYVTNTAGAILVTGTFTSAGTAGSQILTFTNTSGTTTIAANLAVAVVKASCATSYGCMVSLFATKSI
jgi:hypothetical protein